MTKTILREAVRLGTVRGADDARIVCNAVFNRFRVDAYQLAVYSRDTTFDYAIMTDERLNKASLAAVVAFVEGVDVGLRARS